MKKIKLKILLIILILIISFGILLFSYKSVNALSFLEKMFGSNEASITGMAEAEFDPYEAPSKEELIKKGIKNIEEAIFIGEVTGAPAEQIGGLNVLKIDQELKLDDTNPQLSSEQKLTNSIEKLLGLNQASLEGKNLAYEVLADTYFSRGLNKAKINTVEGYVNIKYPDKIVIIDPDPVSPLTYIIKYPKVKIKIELKKEYDSEGNIISIKRQITEWSVDESVNWLIKKGEVCNALILLDNPSCASNEVMIKYINLFIDLCDKRKDLNSLRDERAKGALEIYDDTNSIDNSVIYQSVKSDFDSAIEYLNKIKFEEQPAPGESEKSDKDYFIRAKVYTKLGAFNQITGNYDESIKYLNLLLKEKKLSDNDRSKYLNNLAILERFDKSTSYPIEEGLVLVNEALKYNPSSDKARNQKKELQMEILEFIKRATFNRANEEAENLIKDLDETLFGLLPTGEWRRKVCPVFLGYSANQLAAEGDILSKESLKQYEAINFLIIAVNQGHFIEDFYGDETKLPENPTNADYYKIIEIRAKKLEKLQLLIREVLTKSCGVYPTKTNPGVAGKTIEKQLNDEEIGAKQIIQSVLAEEELKNKQTAIVNFYTVLVYNLLIKNPDIALIAGGGNILAPKGSQEMLSRLPNYYFYKFTGTRKTKNPKKPMELIYEKVNIEDFTKQCQDIKFCEKGSCRNGRFIFTIDNEDCKFYKYGGITTSWRDKLTRNWLNIVTIEEIIIPLIPFLTLPGWIAKPIGTIGASGEPLSLVGWGYTRFVVVRWATDSLGGARNLIARSIANTATAGYLKVHFPRAYTILGLGLEIPVTVTSITTVMEASRFALGSVGGELVNAFLMFIPIGSPIIHEEMYALTRLVYSKNYLDNMLELLQKEAKSAKIKEVFAANLEGRNKLFFVMTSSGNDETVFIRKFLKNRLEIESNPLILTLENSAQLPFNQFRLSKDVNLIFRREANSAYPWFDYSRMQNVLQSSVKKYDALSGEINSIIQKIGIKNEKELLSILQKNYYAELTKNQVYSLLKESELRPVKLSELSGKISDCCKGKTGKILVWDAEDLIRAGTFQELKSSENYFIAVAENGRAVISTEGPGDEIARKIKELMDNDKIISLVKFKVNEDGDIISNSFEVVPHLSTFQGEAMKLIANQALKSRGYRLRFYKTDEEAILKKFAKREYFDEATQTRIIVRNIEPDKKVIELIDADGMRVAVPAQDDGRIFYADGKAVTLSVVEIKTTTGIERRLKAVECDNSMLMPDGERFVLVRGKSGEKDWVKKGEKEQLRNPVPEDPQVIYNQDTGKIDVDYEGSGYYINGEVFSTKDNIALLEVLDETGEIEQVLVRVQENKVENIINDRPTYLRDENIGDSFVLEGENYIKAEGVDKNGRVLYGSDLTKKLLIRYPERAPKVYEPSDGEFYDSVTGAYYFFKNNLNPRKALIYLEDYKLPSEGAEIPSGPAIIYADVVDDEPLLFMTRKNEWNNFEDLNPDKHGFAFLDSNSGRRLVFGQDPAAQEGKWLLCDKRVSDNLLFEKNLVSPAKNGKGFRVYTDPVRGEIYVREITLDSNSQISSIGSLRKFNPEIDDFGNMIGDNQENAFFDPLHGEFIMSSPWLDKRLIINVKTKEVKIERVSVDSAGNIHPEYRTFRAAKESPRGRGEFGGKSYEGGENYGIQFDEKGNVIFLGEKGDVNVYVEDGRIVFHTSDEKVPVMLKDDGTIDITYADGTVETYKVQADGSIKLISPQGGKIDISDENLEIKIPDTEAPKTGEATPETGYLRLYKGENIDESVLELKSSVDSSEGPVEIILNENTNLKIFLNDDELRIFDEYNPDGMVVGMHSENLEDVQLSLFSDDNGNVLSQEINVRDLLKVVRHEPGYEIIELPNGLYIDSSGRLAARLPNGGKLKVYNPKGRLNIEVAKPASGSEKGLLKISRGNLDDEVYEDGLRWALVLQDHPDSPSTLRPQLESLNANIPERNLRKGLILSVLDEKRRGIIFEQSVIARYDNEFNLIAIYDTDSLEQIAFDKSTGTLVKGNKGKYEELKQNGADGNPNKVVKIQKNQEITLSNPLIDENLYISTGDNLITQPYPHLLDLNSGPKVEDIIIEDSTRGTIFWNPNLEPRLYKKGESEPFIIIKEEIFYDSVKERVAVFYPKPAEVNGISSDKWYPEVKKVSENTPEIIYKDPVSEEFILYNYQTQDKKIITKEMILSDRKWREIESVRDGVDISAPKLKSITKQKVRIIRSYLLNDKEGTSIRLAFDEVDGELALVNENGERIIGRENDLFVDGCGNVLKPNDKLVLQILGSKLQKIAKIPISYRYDNVVPRIFETSTGAERTIMKDNEKFLVLVGNDGTRIFIKDANGQHIKIDQVVRFRVVPEKSADVCILPAPKNPALAETPVGQITRLAFSPVKKELRISDLRGNQIILPEDSILMDSNGNIIHYDSILILSILDEEGKKIKDIYAKIIFNRGKLKILDKDNRIISLDEDGLIIVSGRKGTEDIIDNQGIPIQWNDGMSIVLGDTKQNPVTERLSTTPEGKGYQIGRDVKLKFNAKDKRLSLFENNYRKELLLTEDDVIADSFDGSLIFGKPAKLKILNPNLNTIQEIEIVVRLEDGYPRIYDINGREIKLDEQGYVAYSGKDGIERIKDVNGDDIQWKSAMSFRVGETPGQNTEIIIPKPTPENPSVYQMKVNSRLKFNPNSKELEILNIRSERVYLKPNQDKLVDSEGNVLPIDQEIYMTIFKRGGTTPWKKAQSLKVKLKFDYMNTNVYIIGENGGVLKLDNSFIPSYEAGFLVEQTSSGPKIILDLNGKELWISRPNFKIELSLNPIDNVPVISPVPEIRAGKTVRVGSYARLTISSNGISLKRTGKNVELFENDVLIDSFGEKPTQVTQQGNYFIQGLTIPEICEKYASAQKNFRGQRERNCGLREKLLHARNHEHKHDSHGYDEGSQDCGRIYQCGSQPLSEFTASFQIGRDLEQHFF